MSSNIEIHRLATNLYQSDGIYYAHSKSAVSYPDEGNEYCLQLEDNSFWFMHRNNCIAHLVKKFSPEKIFWDIGGGNGFVSRHLQNNGVETILLEPGQQGAKNAKRRGIENVVCATLEDAGLKAGIIHSAGMFDVVEHIEDDQGFLRKVREACASDACIYITVPAYSSLWSGEDIEAGHFRRYTLRRLAALLKQSGFSPVFQTYIFSFLPLPVFLFRTLPTLLGVSRSSDLKKYSKEHQAFNLSGILGRILKWEEQRLKNLKSIPFGGSCLIVAKAVR